MRRWLWLLLVLVATVASGQRLTTFAWNAGANWPPGTTVELCGNGDVCLSGITGRQATINLPVQPGAVIEGRARAIPPPGYQCGEPLADCPPSGWATLKKTWPALPVGGWARYERRDTTMAVEFISATQISVPYANRNSSQSVTVPADATLALGLIGGYGGYNLTFDVSQLVLTLGGSALANGAYTGNSSNDNQSKIEYLANPSTGSQTLAWDLTDWYKSSGDAANMYITLAYFKGVDTASPIADSDAVQGSQSISGLSYSSGDMTVGVVASDSDPTVTGSGQTQIGSTQGPWYGGSAGYVGCAYKADSSSWSSTSSSPGVSVVVVKASGGSASALPRRAIDGPFYGSLRGSVR